MGLRDRIVPARAGIREESVVLLAAGTARGAGGVLALRAACADLSKRAGTTVVQAPRRPDPAPLPPGPQYIHLTRLGAIVRELTGPARRDVGTYVGLSDRLPLLRSFPRQVMVAQNPHLYGARTTELTRPQRARIAVLGIWARRSARRADLIVTASETTGRELARSAKVDVSRIVVRPIPAMDVGHVKRAHRKEIARIALVGDVYSYKRFDWAVDEIQQWASGEGRTVEIYHAGGNPEGRAWRSFQDALRRSPAVVGTCQGKLPHLDAMALLIAADLFVFPSMRESFGLPLAEALAVAVPAVCSDLEPFREIGGPAPMFFDGTDGSLVAALHRVGPQSVREEMAILGSAQWRRGGGWNVIDGVDDVDDRK